jgi:hypothetical protein
MKLNEFKNKAENLMKQFQELINEMPQKGLKTTDCQRMKLQQSLNELSYSVNGTEEDDMIDKL